MTIRPLPTRNAGRHWIAVLLAVLTLAGVAGAQGPRATEDMFLVGVAPPRFAPGVAASPLPFEEESAKILKGAWYRPVPVAAVEFPAAATAADATALMAGRRLDGLWTVRVTAVGEVCQEAFFGLKRTWHVALEATLYRFRPPSAPAAPVSLGSDLPAASTGPGSAAAWTTSVTLDEPLAAPDETATRARQAAEAGRKAVVRLLTALVEHIGYQPEDHAPPDIAIDYPREALSQRTSTVLLLGRVTDASKVTAVRVNGQAMSFFPQRACTIYYPVRFAPGRLREPLPVTVEAEDVYGNTGRQTVMLYRGKPLEGSVVTSYGRDFLLDRGHLHGIVRGMAFTAFHLERVRDPVTGVRRTDVLEVGPAIVTTVYAERSAARLLVPGQLSRGDLLK